VYLVGRSVVKFTFLILVSIHFCHSVLAGCFNRLESLALLASSARYHRILVRQTPGLPALVHGLEKRWQVLHGQLQPTNRACSMFFCLSYYAEHNFFCIILKLVFTNHTGRPPGTSTAVDSTTVAGPDSLSANF
jgi:hypothetical protein